MKKRMISFILVIIMLFSVFTPVYASNSEYKQPISAYGDEMLEYLLTDNHKLLVIRDNYGYMQFADKFRQNAASLFLLEMTDLLIQTGMEPDKSKYIEVLINIMGTYELDNATDISTQKSMDNLKSVQDYAMDIVDIGTKAVSFMVANNPEVSEFEEAISTAIGRMSTLKDDINNWVEALSDLETIVEDYSKYDDFLELIEQKSTGELKEAASTLRSGMRKAFTIKLDTYGEVSDDNFDNFSELFFSDIFWKVLKQTEDYEKDETLKEVVDAGDSFVSKIEDLINSWELALGIGKLVGNVTVGAENLVNRVLEIFALSDISAILQLEVTELSIDFFEKIGTQEEEKSIDQYELFAQYLIGCRIRGEYCLYSIVANDAGLLSWFNKKSAEEAKNWYETKADKILDIQKELLKVKQKNKSNSGIDAFSNSIVEITEYIGNFEQVVEIMSMSYDNGAMTGSNNYCIDNFKLSWDDNGYYAVSNSGNEKVTLYGVCIGDDKTNVLQKIQKLGYTYQYSSDESDTIYLLDNGKIIYIEIIYDNERVATWYVNNYEEGENIIEIKEVLELKEQYNVKDLEQWKSAYIDFIFVKGINYDYWSNRYLEEYKLVNVNGDDIPELYINFGSTADGDMLCSYFNNSVIYQYMWNYGFSYIEGKNLFMDSGGHMDAYYDTIYSIENGTFVEQYKGEYESEGNSIYSYYWNGNKVSNKDEYEELLNQVFDKEKAKNLYENDNVYDYQEIIKQIIEY